MPKISVIVPVYKVEKYLHRCLDSLTGQSFTDMEIICVDDGSPDNCGKILDEYAAKDDRIKVIHQVNGGLSNARNSGLAAAAGEYICFVDSDDFVDLQFLEKLYDAAERNHADIAAASIIRKREHREKYRVCYTEEKVYETLAEKIAACSVPKCCYVWSKLYRRELIDGEKFTEGVYFEDVLWTPGVLKKSAKLVVVPGVNYYYWVNSASIVKQKPTAKKVADRANSKRFIINFFEANGLPLSQRDQMINKRIISLGRITLFKIKEYKNREYFCLFGAIPLFSRWESPGRVCYNFTGLKISRSKNKYSEKKQQELNAAYENGTGIVPKVASSEKTLQELVNSSKSIVRYGDGEFNLISGESLPFQKYESGLAGRLKEILKSDNENVMVAIPDVFGGLTRYNAASAAFWRKKIVRQREYIYSILQMDKQYFDSLVSRPYMDAADRSGVQEFFRNFKNIWENKNIVFVEGGMSRLGVGNDLFDNAAAIKRIICPELNAFGSYAKILEVCKKQPQDTLFILALGPTATVLAYDLCAAGFRALDLGHIDIEYEWFLMKADKKTAVKNKYVNEVKKGRVFSEINDEKYLSEIIGILKQL